MVHTSAVGTETGQQLETDVAFDAHGSSVDLEDVGPSLEIGKTELDFTIQPTGTHQSGVQSIRTIRSHKDL